MPKKRKNGQSPARAPGQLNESWSNTDNRVYGASEPCLQGEPNRSNSGYGTSNSSAGLLSDREHIMRNMEEVFSHLDPEVIHMVLTECDFNMENAMDSLLELADAAKEAPSLPPSVSGFEIAAAVLNPDVSQSMSTLPNPTVSSTLPVHTPLALTHHSQSQSSTFSASVCLSSLPTPQPPLVCNPRVESDSAQHLTSEHRQKQASRGNSPVGELSFAFGSASVEQSDRLDRVTLHGGSVGLGGSGSAFQAYRRDEQPLGGRAGGPWNVAAAEFHPRSEGPAFIMPVAVNPTLAARWSTYGHVSQAPLKPTATIPTAWTIQQPSIHSSKPTTAPTSSHRLRFEGRVLVLLRGAPGSGKSSLARAMLDHNPAGVSLSTDEYFYHHDNYCYNPSELGTAHEWNQQRAKEAMERGQSPVIIDNTNMQSWEMKPYVAMALKLKYRVVFREPDTWWKYKPRELEKHTKHGVTRDKIRRMLEGYDRHVSISSIMGSARPELHREPPLTSDLPRPDLLGPPPPVSLPDVSSMPAGSVFAGHPPELLDCVDLYQDPQEVNKRLPLEPPVAFSESIAQRERRERDRGRHPASPRPAVDQSTEEGGGVGANGELLASGSAEVDEQVAKGNGAQGAPLAFVGDWPFESQEPRGQRASNRRRTEKKARRQGDGAGTETKGGGGGPDFSEFQKLLDLLQGDAEVGGLIELSDSEEGSHSSPSSPRSPSSPSSGPDTQPPSPSCLAEDRTCVPTSSREDDLVGDEDRGTDSGDEGRKEGEEMEKETESEWREMKESEAVLEKESEGKGQERAEEDKGGSGSCHSSEKKRLSRRAAKPCRLALTFTNQVPLSVSPHHPQPGSPLQPGRHTQDVSTDTVSSRSVSTQTESCDLALLWRLQHGGLWEGIGEKVLTGNVSHFVPAVSKTTSACPGQRVTHERGAQVEEEELTEAGTKDEGLSILIRHFKGVAVETLKDLYEKCQQDLEWTTNLLLDSGEELSREDDEGDGTDDEDGLDELNEEGEGNGAGEKEDLEREAIEESKREGDEADGIGIAKGRREGAEADVSSCDPAVVEVSRSDKVAHVRSEDAGHHSQPRQLSESQLEQSAQEPASQAAPSSQAQEASQQEVTSESQRDLTERAGTGAHLLMDACSERPEWAVRLLREDGGEGERDEERDMGEISKDVDAVTQSILAQLEELSRREEQEREREKQEREREKQERQKERTRGSKPLDIQSLELKLPTELALQLTELFGPVGIDPGEFSDDCSVKMDLNLARLLHQKWKETIQEKQREAILSFHLLHESSVHWGEPQTASRPQDRTKPHFLIGPDGYASLGSQSDSAEDTPVVDYRSLCQPYVSLRNIMSEEQALQDLEKSRLSRWDPELRDGAAMLKEKQLFSHFPAIDKLFLKDIFRDHNYSLEQTEKFLHSLLDIGPVNNVVATESATQHNHTHTPRTPSRERVQTNRQKETEQVFQDTEDPEYQDFRAEANLQRFKQQECFSKAAEAHRRGKRQVASFYAQQGHLHGQKMREANHRAALCIFERVNASLLPQNVLDLHGLHVSEAIKKLQQILKEKSTEFRQGLCRPQLSIITGRGNRSQGGVARIRPAVIDYLNSKHYEFTEPNVGLVLVSLQKEPKQ